MRHKAYAATQEHLANAVANSKRFRENHVAKSSRLGLMQVRVNDEVAVTLDGAHQLTLGQLKRTYARHAGIADKIIVEIHNYKSKESFEFLTDECVWVKVNEAEDLV